MRSRVVVLLTAMVVLVLAPDLLARDKHSWEQVEKLKPGSPVLVGLWSGEILSGHVVTVSPAGVRLSPYYPVTIGTQLAEIGRATIRRIVLVRHKKLPDPGPWMLTGALVGGGVGATAGAIHDATHHDGSGPHWVTGGLGGAGLGFFGSCVVLTGVGVAELFHYNRIVYEDGHTGKVGAH